MSLLLQRREASRAEINITSLVDVTMTVLIIFILIAPIIEQGIDVELPSASATRIEQPEEPVTVSLQEIMENGQKKGVIFVDEQRMTGNPFETLRETLVAMRGRKPKVAVIIRADKDFKYEAVIKVLDVVRSAGITTLSLATQAE
jgi:biopolymer transport protein TolR